MLAQGVQGSTTCTRKVCVSQKLKQRNTSENLWSERFLWIVPTQTSVLTLWNLVAIVKEFLLRRLSGFPGEAGRRPTTRQTEKCCALLRSVLWWLASHGKSIIFAAGWWWCGGEGRLLILTYSSFLPLKSGIYGPSGTAKKLLLDKVKSDLGVKCAERHEIPLKCTLNMCAGEKSPSSPFLFLVFYFLFLLFCLSPLLVFSFTYFFYFLFLQISFPSFFFFPYFQDDFLFLTNGICMASRYCRRHEYCSGKLCICERRRIQAEDLGAVSIQMLMCVLGFAVRSENCPRFLISPQQPSSELIHGGVRYLQKAIMKSDYKQVNASFFLGSWHLSAEFLVPLVILLYLPPCVHLSFGGSSDMFALNNCLPENFCLFERILRKKQQREEKKPTLCCCHSGHSGPEMISRWWMRTPVRPPLCGNCFRRLTRVQTEMSPFSVTFHSIWEISLFSACVFLRSLIFLSVRTRRGLGGERHRSPISVIAGNAAASAGTLTVKCRLVGSKRRRGNIYYRCHVM